MNSSQVVQTGNQLPRVCLVTDNLNIGGSQVDLADLAKGLKKKGYPLLLCCLRTGGALTKSVNNAGIKVIVLGKRFKFDFFTLFRLIRLLYREKIDLVHSTLFTANAYARVAGHIARTPVIIASDQSLGFERNFWQKRVDRFLKRWTDVMIADSTAVGKRLIEYDRLSPNQVKVIVNGIDIDLIREKEGWRESARRELNIPEEVFVVGTIARFTFEKGLISFVESIPHILNTCSNVYFLIVGDAQLPQEQTYKKEVEERIIALNLKKKIILTGFREDIGRMLAAMDIFVSPSIVENFPNTIMEAMGAGKAVIATRIGSITDAVVEGETGLLVPPNNPKVMAESILTLLHDRHGREYMGKAGKRRAEERFSRARVVNEAADLYSKIFSTKKITNKKD